ncbi:CinA family protein [Pelagibacterium halotolerans]|uniref:C-terminal domain of CinA type S, protein Implicated in DNA repair function with RecA and MutS n=1 Tax=Pelagibacterium halotolerans (strain DSM 22347 / JCM 15775 / CGMCC 1.7692 / B2) TaxID=1082931 RepID=G4R8Z6_PELHB|nr:CinA family protein [Pelagibacterium halotolerans]AEQ51413.1 C-terminal domain of CinA type S, protein Implicated in DNA repair function with RecA and MutS [Pelagibacterium halotolerans B2]QJR18744.1 CinA family protein [Pelagibacterium halotolerans]SEA12811.1 nicotinamide-nucleotide amidase [Pelagibacterium halotolerans]
MLDNETLALAKKINDRLILAGHMMVTAESCTGGLIAGAITSVSGSSAMLYGGFVTYSNEAKKAMIGVPVALIEQYGAVSEPVARAMAEGALHKAGVDLAISVTGIAGPGGGSDEKPIGLVHFGLATPAKTIHREERFGDLGRDGIRQATVRVALEMVLDAYAP